MDNNSRIFDFLYHALEHFPKPDMFAGKEAGIWKKFSTREIAETVNKLSAGLLELGLSGNNMEVEQQDKVAIISRNRPEWLMLDLACQQIGVALCPIYPTTNIHEIEFIFNESEIKHVFISGEEILEKINKVKPHVPSLKNVYSFDALAQVEHWQVLLKDSLSGTKEKLENWKKKISATHCATIIYTSGTTGTPKGVMLSHRNLVSNVLNSKKSFPFEDQIHGRALSFLPLNHIFERMVSYIYIHSGISVYYAESLDKIGDNLKEVQPTLFTTVPRLLEKVYERIMQKAAELSGIKKKLFFWAVSLGEKYDNLSSPGLWYNFQLAIANKIIFSKWREGLGNKVETIITGGAACQIKLLRIFNAARIPIYEGYGPTENSPVISVNSKRKGGMKIGTVGIPIQGQELKLEPDGEICVKGPSVMMGYYKHPDLTAEVLIDGWLHTGDIGQMEDQKFLRITDRKKELFKTSGGKYVAPQAIENKLKESPFIEQIMVLGADQKFVGALIVPSILHLKEWMKQKNIPFTTNTDAINQPQVLQLYKDIIESFNEFFNHVEQIKKFELLPEEWGIDTGEMTPKLSLKRKVIMEKFRQSIEHIYA
ncbi:MAG: long-chain fatty acid--CoA ligase [Chitinophagaceae bacterium]|nr:long-chain fatty acid--CoA ligase [Chitinophagaceae bacterium]